MLCTKYYFHFSLFFSINTYSTVVFEHVIVCLSYLLFVSFKMLIAFFKLFYYYYHHIFIVASTTSKIRSNIFNFNINIVYVSYNNYLSARKCIHSLQHRRVKKITSRMFFTRIRTY